MQHALWLTLVRCDGKPDNRILKVLDTLKKHGFEFDTPQYHGGYAGLVGMCYEYAGLLPVEQALANLAEELGQDNPALNGKPVVPRILESA